MKKFIFAAALVALLGTSLPAMAAPWSSALQAAVNSGNTGQINAIAAAHPDAQGEMALFLLQQVAALLATKPELAAKIFAATGPFVPQVPAGQSPSAADILIKIIQTAKDSGFQQKDCRGALTILGAALSMSSMPNIVVASPNLHAVA
ncbi:MAG: hypothetical protein HY053_04065, partial [Proteobacteria bacterium]|nr:hypothetical protein [Pseudomonadota bacterium]